MQHQQTGMMWKPFQPKVPPPTPTPIATATRGMLCDLPVSRGAIFCALLGLHALWLLLRRQISNEKKSKKVGQGLSSSSVVSQAVKEAIAATGVRRPTFAWIACHGAEEEGLAESVVKAFAKELPGCKLHGCTVACSLEPGHKKTMLDSKVSILAFDAPGGFLTAAAVDHADAARELKQRIGKDTPSAILMHTTPGNEERGLEALAAEFPGVPIYGGTAADANLKGSWFVLSDRIGAMPNGMSLVAVRGSVVDFGASMLAPYTAKMASASVVSRASGRTVFEIDGKPALEWVAKYLGPSGAEAVRAGGMILPHTAHKPISIQREGQEPLTAHCASILPAADGNGGGVNFFVEVHKGDTLLEMDPAHGPATDIAATLTGAYDAALQAGSISDPTAAVIIVCGGIALAAHKNLRDALSSSSFLERTTGLSILGITVYGEQSASGRFGKSHHQNLCIGMLLFKVLPLPAPPVLSIMAAMKVLLVAAAGEGLASVIGSLDHWHQWVHRHTGKDASVAIATAAMLLLLTRLLLSPNRQHDGYNQAPLHPVYPSTLLLLLFIAGFWLGAYTLLPGFWFLTLVYGSAGSLAAILVMFLVSTRLMWEKHILQRVLRGHIKENLEDAGYGLHQQRPHTVENFITKELKAALNQKRNSKISPEAHLLGKRNADGSHVVGGTDRLALLMASHRKSVASMALKSAEGPKEPDARSMPRSETHELCDHTHDLQLAEAHQLVMSKLFVPFFDFLWIWLYVAPNAVLLWFTGIVNLLARQWLFRKRWIRRVDFCAPEVAAQLVLEQMQLIYYVRTEYRYVVWRKEHAPIGIFVWPDFPTLDEHGNLKVYKQMHIELDLEGRRFHQGWLTHQSGEIMWLTAEQAVIMIWFDTISATHVKLHAYANWATNVSVPMPFARRNSVITIMYNFFGYETFPILAARWRDTCCAKHDFTRITDVFDHGVSRGVPGHARIHEILKYSQLANFIVKVRSNFLSLYSDFRADFLAMDGEAMFIGTILHSLDHSLMSWNLLDPLWLNIDDPKLGVCAEVGRFVRAGFVDDLPFIAFATRYKDAPHPFYRAVYRHAKGINKRLADHMDTCIIK